MPQVSPDASFAHMARGAREWLKWPALGALCCTLLACRARADPSLSNEALGPPALSAAMADLPRDRVFPARLVTDSGTLHCELDPRGAPHAVALFVGFATGRARFRDPNTGKVA